MSVCLRRLGLLVLLVLPWLWPFTSGPTAGAQPYLVSLTCAALLLALWPVRQDARQFPKLEIVVSLNGVGLHDADFPVQNNRRAVQDGGNRLPGQSGDSRRGCRRRGFSQYGYR